MTLSEIINTGMNNPECSFFVGVMMGNVLMFKLFMMMAVAYFMFKIIDKLALDPTLAWIKRKFKQWVK